MIRLYDYHLDENGFRVRLLLSMLGLAFETVAVDKAPGREQEKPHMLALNPTGTLPILEDGNVRLFGTAAILAYLVRAHAPDSPWLPADAADFGRVQHHVSALPAAPHLAQQAAGVGGALWHVEMGGNLGHGLQTFKPRA